jgi:hypothetical protein
MWGCPTNQVPLASSFQPQTRNERQQMFTSVFTFAVYATETPVSQVADFIGDIGRTRP